MAGSPGSADALRRLTGSRTALPPLGPPLLPQGLLKMLIDDFALAPHANQRKGGLIGLAAVSVALAGSPLSHVKEIVPPVLKAFTDAEARVRYYAVESLYNIAKVAREDIVAFFAEIFDVLCKLSADADPNVRNAVHLLDRLMKDIVTDSSHFQAIGHQLP